MFHFSESRNCGHSTFKSSLIFKFEKSAILPPEILTLIPNVQNNTNNKIK